MIPTVFETSLKSVRFLHRGEVRDIYEVDYPPESIASGSLLLGWAYLAEFEPPLCAPFFYSVDWLDPDPAAGGRP